MIEGTPLLQTAADEATEPPNGGSLLQRHRLGDREAFAKLVADYRAPVFGYLVRCGVEAADRDDLFQDIFLKIHRAASSYRETRPLHPWVFTIVANTVRNHFRRLRVRELVDGGAARPEIVDPAPDGARRAEAKQAARRLEEDIRRLPLGQRQVLLLACVESLPLEEVARVLALPLNTVKTRLRRARLALVEARRRRVVSDPAVESEAARSRENAAGREGDNGEESP